VTIDHEGYELGDLIFVAELEAVAAKHLATVLLDLVCCAVELFHGTSNQNHPCTECGKLVRDAAAEPATTSGDQDGLSVE
jgi:hypothetical protein